MWESRRLCEISKELWIEWETCRWFSTRSIVSSFPQLSAGLSTTKPGAGRHGICHLNPHQIAKNLQELAPRDTQGARSNDPPRPPLTVVAFQVRPQAHLLHHAGGSGPFPTGCNFENGLVTRFLSA